ncbi:MAG: cobalamin 5'-phosphate synthase [Nitrospinae bacterium RIFCSPLOWO2_02_FULL_39_110]|nr:MAG: cobalamin 5'-phosphate synthase [Nitrospinae bacterium RIFCSPHIGHO2_02_39_11]OGV98700.1 MAG: cobalamin 5'-phosphate synthase [Nitrospinae bacterium RIFCSPHIGHO2_12_FULL_39_42]OGW02712.1 MAG: cobalamin 5'-phosphate synthase [Nitrospinae bacterium RIFCSPHIGHO2_02_FULL_39_82]OGW06983.1 MAG: cobalamin 5'-phosphate synthase [Nitrospinae bacterium RIFCSPLOWO2_02_FULL_39_110]OGW07312.1 MAG: cobalamin 5'-phosphate synthase [Nitrospinae bacterium RIFCSPLOWO2_02_39_17]OGW11296.1 MAG: cobalamin 5
MNYELIKDFLLSIQFLTIINIQNSRGTDYEKRLRGTTIFFPFVGLLIGIILFLTAKLSSLLLPLSVSDALVLIVLIIITGGLHIDGFADTIDGFAGGKDKENILIIMKDSRIGTFGVTGLIMFLMTKYLAIQSLPVDSKYLILTVMPVFGRWSVLPMGLLFEYARTGGGTGKAFAGSIKLKEFIIGTILSSVIIVSLLGVKGFLMIAVIFIATLIIGRYSENRIGGITGDVFGATIEINELITIIMALVLFNGE